MIVMAQTHRSEWQVKQQLNGAAPWLEFEPLDRGGSLVTLRSAQLPGATLAQALLAFVLEFPLQDMALEASSRERHEISARLALGSRHFTEQSRERVLAFVRLLRNP